MRSGGIARLATAENRFRVFDPLEKLNYLPTRPKFSRRDAPPQFTSLLLFKSPGKVERLCFKFLARVSMTVRNRCSFLQTHFLNKWKSFVFVNPNLDGRFAELL